MVRKGNNGQNVTSDYVVLDLETTGLDPRHNEIIEVAAIRVRNHVVEDRFTCLVKPQKPIDQFITKLTGITNEMLADAYPIGDVLPKFLAFIGNDKIVGHNVSFDLSFLRQAASSLSLNISTPNYIDTLRISRQVHPELPHHRLGDMVEYFQIRTETAHRALADCESTQQIYEQLLLELEKLMPITRNTKSQTRENECFDHPIGYDDWARAEELRKAGDFESALSMLDAAKAKGYQAPALYKSYTMIYHKTKEYRKELAVLDEALACPNRNGRLFIELEERRPRVQELLEKAIAEKQAACEKERLRSEKQKATSEAKNYHGRAILQMTEDMTVLRRYESIAEAVRESGVNSKSIRDAANGVQKRAGGYVWRYEDSM